MLDDTPRAAHIQRCTYTELRGRRHWQCLLQDPHPDQGHQLPIDSRFGQPLHEMHPEKLAALLRDQVALNDNLQRRRDELQALAIDIARSWADNSADLPNPDHLTPATVEWLRTNAPTTAFMLGLSS